MNYRNLFNDRCVVQTRSVDSSGMVDNESWAGQTAGPCRVIKSITKRRTSPDGAEKVQYGSFVFLTVLLPKHAIIKEHDRILYPVTDGIVYDVIAVTEARDSRGVHHLVANCDARV